MQKTLIVGLGNIGDAYAQTRHNIGFDMLDFWQSKLELPWKSDRFGQTLQFKYKGRPVTLLKPDTYMNLSGNAVNFWLNKENIALENCLIITDDLNLDFGTIRIRPKGSHGGHNGLRSVEEVLLTTQYNRFRFGVGNDFSKGEQVDFVLGKWDDEQLQHLPERLEKACKALQTFVFRGINDTMNGFNGK